MPYRAYQTADGNILFGGGNDRLFGILCDKLGHPEWATDVRFYTNATRVDNRLVLDDLIESETKKRTTMEWLNEFDQSGMPYAAINDIQSTLRHEHGMLEISSGQLYYAADWSLLKYWRARWSRR